ncbi:MAG: hypothetical protein ACOY4I_04765 [Bacillota bacterium]
MPNYEYDGVKLKIRPNQEEVIKDKAKREGLNKLTIQEKDVLLKAFLKELK